MNRKQIKITVAAVSAAVLLMPMLALAALPQATIPVTTSGQGFTLTEIQDLIKLAAQFLITISIIVAVIFIVWGAIKWMVAQGNDEAVGAAKKTIINGVIGAAVVLGVGVILQTVANLVTRSFFQ